MLGYVHGDLEIVAARAAIDRPLGIPDSEIDP